MDVINELILQAAASPWLLLVIFSVSLIDGVFPPVPSETVLVAASAVAASHGDYQTIALLCLVAAVGAILGDNLAYLIGSKIGVTRFRWMNRPRVAAAFAHAQRSLERRGAPLILGARYIPVGRVAVNLSAGGLGYPWRRFLPHSVVIGTLAGHWLGEQPLLSAVLGVAFALVLGVVIDRITSARRRRAERTAPELSAPELSAPPTPTREVPLQSS